MAVKASLGTWPFVFGFARPATLEQALQAAAAFGYDGVELAGFGGHATAARYPDPPSRERLRAQLEELGLEPRLLVPSPEAGERADRDWWEEQIRLAAELGVAAVVIPGPGISAPLPYGSDYERVLAEVVELYRWLAERAAVHGCGLLWEMETNQPFNKPSEVVRILDQVDHPNFKLLYDTGHFHAAVVIGHNHVQPAELLPGGQVEMLSRLRGRIGHVHLCDTDGDIAQNMFARKLALGTGMIDFEALLPALAAAYDGEWWGLDVITLDSGSWGAAWDGLGFIREALADLSAGKGG